MYRPLEPIQVEGSPLPSHLKQVPSTDRVDVVYENALDLREREGRGGELARPPIAEETDIRIEEETRQSVPNGAEGRRIDPLVRSHVIGPFEMRGAALERPGKPPLMFLQFVTAKTA